MTAKRLDCMSNNYFIYTHLSIKKVHRGLLFRTQCIYTPICVALFHTQCVAAICMHLPTLQAGNWRENKINWCSNATKWMGPVFHRWPVYSYSHVDGTKNDQTATSELCGVWFQKSWDLAIWKDDDHDAGNHDADIQCKSGRSDWKQAWPDLTWPDFWPVIGHCAVWRILTTRFYWNYTDRPASY